jgi:hypothetical protein
MSETAKKELVIDVSRVMTFREQHQECLIIQYPTGVHYSAKVGGKPGEEKLVEGFAINLGGDSRVFFAKDYKEECQMLCMARKEFVPEPINASINSDQPVRMLVTARGIFDPKILTKIYNRLIELSLRRGFRYAPNSNCSFGMFLDVNRLNELTEGWWPVVIRERRKIPKEAVSLAYMHKDGIEIMPEVLYTGYFYHEDCNGWRE